MTLCVISLDRYNVIVFPLNPSRSTTNMRSRIMILFVWAYSLPFCRKNWLTLTLLMKKFQEKFHVWSVVPLFEIGGVGGYIPEGFLTACSFDYLDTSAANYWFIFIYAVVRIYKTNIWLTWNFNLLKYLSSFNSLHINRLHILCLWSL